MRTNPIADNLPTAVDSVGEPPWIELTGILHENQQLYAVFRAGPSERILPIDASDLDSFDAFQQLVAKELGMQIRHVSEGEVSPWDRLTAWHKAVELALARGS
jgi:hypothetical protein